MRSEPEDPILRAAADEELRHASTLGWRTLAQVTPWGDSFEGFAPGGRAVIYERNYIWRDGRGGDILVEVVAFYGESRRDKGVVASLIVPRPAPEI